MAYTMNWSDVSKGTFEVLDKQTDITSSSLIIFGKKSFNYGEGLQENLLHILENFASATPPSNPTSGQLWYDTNNNKLQLWDGINWADIIQDGTGSGLDADLLDGLDSSINADIDTVAVRDSSGGLNASYFNSTSLRVLKENIVSFNDSALDVINNTEVFTYNYINDPEKTFRIGIIADDSHEYIASVNHNTFDVNNTVGLLLKAIQELNSELTDIKEEIELLKSKI